MSMRTAQILTVALVATMVSAVLTTVGCEGDKVQPSSTAPKVAKTPAPAKTAEPAKTAAVKTAEPAKTAKTAEPTKTAAAVKTASPVAFEAFAKTATVPAMFVPLVSAAPTVDGTMDAAYAKCKPGTFKFLAGGDTKPTAATTVWAVSTKTDLYVFFKCESPDMDSLLKDVREHDGSVWNDDSVEIFIDPTDKREIDGYSHIAANAIGTTAESRGAAGAEDYSWDPKVKVKNVIGKKDWTVEIAIPFADLVKDTAKINKIWAANFNRMAFLIDGNEDTAWSPTGGTSSHVPDKFGALWIEAGSVDNSK